MSAALILRGRNPDKDFVLHGAPPHYTDRRYYYPTNSDITTTTQNLSQHEYRADRYREMFEDGENLHSSLRNMSRSLRMVSNSIRKNLEEESTAKRYLQSQTGTAVSQDEDADLSPPRRRENRNWLSDSEWNTSSGHHVTFADNVPRGTLLNKSASMPLTETLDRSYENDQEAERLWRTVNTDMDLAEVPITRFTRKDLMASEYFPVTMSCSLSEGSKTPRRSRSRTRTSERLAQSARMRAKTPERTPIPDNYQNMKRLEKLYLVTAETPAIDSYITDDEDEDVHDDLDLDDLDDVDSGCWVVRNLRATVELLIRVVVCSSASAPPTITSPYKEEIGRLRMERLRLEEDHLKELARLSTLERVRGPKPKWYELKDAQFHFEAGKNNDQIRSMQYWSSQSLKTRSQQLGQSYPDLFTLRTRAASFS